MSQDLEGFPFPTKISEPNINSGSPFNPPSVILNSPDQVDALEKAKAVLEDELQTIRAERRTERFFWSFCLIAVLNVYVASHSPVLATVTCILFSLILSLGLAKWLEVPWLSRYLERWFEKMLGNIPRPGETE